jgi:signal transduction histidine kinase
MTNPTLVDRLAALPNLEEIPRAELEWLAEHGELAFHEVGEVMATKGKEVRKLWIILQGHVSVRVDRGSGMRIVMGWGVGEVPGMLPYSRMKSPPGDNFVDERAECLAIGVEQFPEMIQRCPEFTAYTVHLMLDRARSFKISDMQDEKMISLGRLSAGLAHELNNPASAIVRGAKLLRRSVADADAASRALGALGLSEQVLELLDDLRSAGLQKPAEGVLSPLQIADREDELAEWLERHHCDSSPASALADAALDLEDLDRLAEQLDGPTLDVALRWISATFATGSLARDIENAGARIDDLVGAIKRFTYMDSRTGADYVELEPGLRDTVRVLASKARGQGTTVTLDLEENLPRVYASGGELNQVWMNLLDNALDAVGEGGNIAVKGVREAGRVAVRVVDDGSGIPPDVLPKIFDSFFTTKPPGQGTGLGLEITQRVVRHYGGDITVESRPGRTEFKVILKAEPSE